MTTAAGSMTDVSTVNDIGRQGRLVYSRIGDTAQVVKWEAPVSSALDSPEYLEYENWPERRPGTGLAFNDPFRPMSDPARSSHTASERWPEARPASSTSDAIGRELLLEGALVRLFEAYAQEARGERFEDGMGSTFATRVHDSISKDGLVAVAAWERILLRTGNMYETGEELLRQLGLVEHAPSHSLRLRVLTDSIASPDQRIRDAASLGLSFMDDPSALSALRSAYSVEYEPWLKDNFKLVIDQLEDSECRDI